MPRADAKDVLSDPNVLTSTLLLALADAFGPESLEWHPATLRMEFEEHYGVQLTDAAYDRLMTGVVLVTTDRFYKSVQDFVTFANFLTGQPNDPDHFEPPTAAEMAAAISEVLWLTPPDDEDEEPFSEEVCAFVGQVLAEEGFRSAPDVLAIAIWPTGSGPSAADATREFPELAEAARVIEESRVSAVRTAVSEHVGLLLHQLRRLPLKNGSTVELLKRIEGMNDREEPQDRR